MPAKLKEAELVFKFKTTESAFDYTAKIDALLTVGIAALGRADDNSLAEVFGIVREQALTPEQILVEVE